MLEVMDYNAKCSVAVLDGPVVDPLMSVCDSCTASCSCKNNQQCVSGCDSGTNHNNIAYKYYKQHWPNKQ